MGLREEHLPLNGVSYVNNVVFGAGNSFEQLKPEGVSVVTKLAIEDGQGIAVTGSGIMGKVVYGVLQGPRHGLTSCLIEYLPVPTVLFVGPRSGVARPH